jgi:Uma2 family endonuclease
MAVEHSALLTAEDYRMLPEEGGRYELIQGELHMAPAPSRYHQKISGNLEFLLRKHLEMDPAGELYHAPLDVYLSKHDVLQPDLVFVANARRSVLVPEGIRGAPTLVVEILSPSTATLDQSVKKQIYAKTGIEELWLVHPEPKSVSIFRLQEDASHPIQIFQEQDTLTSACFPGLQLLCGEIFRV